MADWMLLAGYIAGWLVTCRVLARYVPSAMDYGLFGLGLGALLWPVWAVIGLFLLPVWLVTRGVGRG